MEDVFLESSLSSPPLKHSLNSKQLEKLCVQMWFSFSLAKTLLINWHTFSGAQRLLKTVGNREKTHGILFANTEQDLKIKIELLSPVISFLWAFKPFVHSKTQGFLQPTLCPLMALYLSTQSPSLDSSACLSKPCLPSKHAYHQEDNLRTNAYEVPGTGSRPFR